MPPEGQTPNLDALMRELDVPAHLRDRFFAGYPYYVGQEASREPGAATTGREPDSKYRLIGDGVFIDAAALDRRPIRFPYAVVESEWPLARQFWRVRLYVLGHPPGLFVETLWHPRWPRAKTVAHGLMTNPTAAHWDELREAARVVSHRLTQPGIRATYETAAALEADIRRAVEELRADLGDPEIGVEMLLGKLPVGRSAFFEAQNRLGVRWRQIVRAMGGRLRR